VDRQTPYQPNFQEVRRVYPSNLLGIT